MWHLRYNRHEALSLIFNYLPTYTYGIIVVVLTLDRCHFTDKFQHYDLGHNKNLQKYGQLKPPEYDLRKVTSPVVLYYSKNDRVVDSGVSIG